MPLAAGTENRDIKYRQNIKYRENGINAFRMSRPVAAAAENMNIRFRTHIGNIKYRKIECILFGDPVLWRQPPKNRFRKFRKNI